MGTRVPSLLREADATCNVAEDMPIISEITGVRGDEIEGTFFYLNLH